MWFFACMSCGLYKYLPVVFNINSSIMFFFGPAWRLNTGHPAGQTTNSVNKSRYFPARRQSMVIKIVLGETCHFA